MFSVWSLTRAANSATSAIALEVTNDDDYNRTVAAEDSDRLKARSGSCAVGSTASWEKFRLYPQ
jgi:hypothetical protein